MSTTLTLKNVPNELYNRLKAAAERHRRSLNSEVIVTLESVLVPANVSVDERLARARQLRKGLATNATATHDIDAFKKQGRA